MGGQHSAGWSALRWPTVELAAFNVDTAAIEAERRHEQNDSMNSLSDIQNWLRTTELAGLVIPSTDEFLSEFPPPANRRLRWATGFRGSTGLAVVLRDSAGLFLDGRYALQGATDTSGTGIAVESATATSRAAWLKRFLLPGDRLGLDPWLHSMPDATQWQSLATELGFELKKIETNPIDQLWAGSRPSEHRPLIVDYPIRYAGETYQAKCEDLFEHTRTSGLQALLVADPEDVSWLLNVRAADEALKSEVGDWHVVPSCTSRALVARSGSVTWFVDRDRLAVDVAARSSDLVTVARPESLATALRDAARQGPIGADLRRTPAAIATMIEDANHVCADDIVARRRWCKHPAEVQSARHAHVVDAAAVVRFMAWLSRTVRERAVSEFEAAQTLESFRAECPTYKGASMPLMSASGASGAQPHYVPSRHGSRSLSDHPIFWMDSGGQYPGGTTDNTITLALGPPEAKHMLAHTLVLQGYIALATARVPVGTSGLHLDTIARRALWGEGMDYAHGTGHGVGNYLNIHEGPHLGREPGPVTTICIEPGMIITNEPGYYADGDFGLRIESHMVVIASARPNFLEFDTISRLPIDPCLVDFSRLSHTERHWLANYHRIVLQDLEQMLDRPSADWLRGVVQAFVREDGLLT
jgi:Xaa-Pro aminopeptidase